MKREVFTFDKNGERIEVGNTVFVRTEEGKVEGIVKQVFADESEPYIIVSVNGEEEIFPIEIVGCCNYVEKMEEAQTYNTELTNKLHYQNTVFHFVGLNDRGDRIYKSLDESQPRTIITNDYDCDGVLIGEIDWIEFVGDDRIRHFNAFTGAKDE